MTKRNTFQDGLIINQFDYKQKQETYTTRRKKIHKGKVAPTGTLFISVSFKRYKNKYEFTQHIKGGLSSEQESMITESMYNSLCDKYNLSK